ncbi:MAG: TatD family hydrolase [Candidatus Paceibacterota bacterium]|jgi:TatD DNase family protein
MLASYRSIFMNASEFKKKHIDAHAHLQFKDFDIDRDDVIIRAQNEGIAIINAGSNAEDSQNAVLLAEKYKENVFACIGLHPGNTYISQYEGSKAEDFNYEYYKKLSKSDSVVGIGECGLDYFKLEGEIEKIKKTQNEIFIQQIELAQEVKKPLVIHCRDAYPDLIKIVNENKEKFSQPPVIHFFVGNIDEARQFLDLGFYFTFGGVITFLPKKNMANMYEEVVRFVPLDRILTETDSPDVAPVPYRGKRNESFYVLEVEKKISEIKNVSQEEASSQIMKNAHAVFGI